MRALADRLRRERQAFVSATVVRAERPTSAKAGDSAIVLRDGTIVGFVGGECAQASVQLQALEALRAGAPVLLKITPGAGAASGRGPAGATDPGTAAHPDRGADPGIVADVDPAVGTDPGRKAPHGPCHEGVVVVHNPCLSGGTLEIFLEPVQPPLLLVVHGRSPIAQAVEDLTARLGWEWSSWSPDRVPEGACGIVIASHGGEEEAAVLRASLDAGVPYVGLVASSRRAAAVVESLRLSEEERKRVHSPAGLDIGSKTAPEVALSILAEVMCLRQRPADAEAAEAVGPQLAVVDPVCGMTVVALATTRHVESDLGEVYFCGSGCEAAYRADPSRFPAR